MSRSRPLKLFFFLATLAIWAEPAQADDSAIFSLIDSARTAAQAIAIDGDGSDWAGIPEFADPVGDAGGEASRDITSVAIAPTADALLVKIETAAPPPTEFLNFWLEIDFFREEGFELMLGLDLSFPDLLNIFPPNDFGIFTSWDDSSKAAGQVFEVRIPYASLAAELPAEMAAELSGANARSWVRVRPFSVGEDLAPLDLGTAVASYLLIPTPYALDPPVPAGGENPTAIPMPLAGKQYVSQGPMTLGSHSGVWAYDINLVNDNLHPDDPFESPNLSDYFSFGLTLTAPVDATVFSMDESQPDLPPRHPGPILTPPNFVFLDIGNDIGLLFSHLIQDSVPVVPLAPVKAGDPIGLVGHSGSASWPHLHLDAQEIDNGFTTTPLAFTHVEVSLNPGAVDPWARALDEWSIRDGFFVEPNPAPPAPDTDSDGVPDAEDNCVLVANPKLGTGGTPAREGFQTTTGGQLDDDADGFGNACDAKFGTPGQFVGGVDIGELLASFNKDRSGANCGGSGNKPCAAFDLDNSGQFIGGGDITRTFQLFNKEPGPTCEACPLECEGPACD